MVEKAVYTIDFETLPIEARPDFPPKPVCVSIKELGKAPRFYHGEQAMKAALAPILEGKRELLFHNAAFDVSVMVEKLGLPMPRWERIHDTMFLLFLEDPYANYALKPAAEAYLGIGEEDQQELEHWIRSHVPEARNKKLWGKWIGYAPEPLLRKRAHGDTIRTEKLYQLLRPNVEARGMQEAYYRERRLLPMLLDNSRRGVNVNRKAIQDSTAQMEDAIVKVDNLIRKVLKAPGLNPGSPAELIKAIDRVGLGGNWLKTPGGKDSAAKNSLLQGVRDPKLLAILQYRGKVETALTTFLRNWCEVLGTTGTKLYTQWNQVKGEGAGAATGRKSSKPNFQNIPKLLKADDLLELGLPPIVRFKPFFYPDAGELWLRRDFSQQELRILAHMEGGALLQLYLSNPRIDLHQYAADALKDYDLMRPEVQIKVNRYDDPRGIAKMIAFSLLYGMGNGELAYRLGVSEAEAKRVRKAYLDLWPGLEKLQKTLKLRARFDQPITTWGGREYYVQPPKVIEGRLRSFDYKLLNYLIQGSAADCTKEALCRLWEAGLPGRLLLDVHDEISWSIPKKQAREVAMEIGRIMMSVEFDVPMLSDAEVGPCWGDLKKEPKW